MKAVFMILYEISWLFRYFSRIGLKKHIVHEALSQSLGRTTTIHDGKPDVSEKFIKIIGLKLTISNLV